MQAMSKPPNVGKYCAAKSRIWLIPRLRLLGTTVFSIACANAWLMHVLKKLPATEADVAEAAEWYEAQRPGLGQRFVLAIQSADKLLLANPLRCSIRFADIRRFNLSDFPYALFFFVHEDVIV